MPIPRRPLLLSLLLAVAVTAPALVLAPRDAYAAPAAGLCVPTPVAHRGDSWHAPENTMPAYHRALRQHVWRLETDVRFTADGVPVLMHDPTVDRTTNGTGQVAALTFADVRALDAGSWFSRDFTGVRVPTLQQLLEYGRYRNAYFLLELKVRPTPEQLQAFLALLRSSRMLGRVQVTSFNPRTLLDVRAAQRGLRTGLIDNPRPRATRAVLRYGRTYIVHHYSVTESRAERWKRAGIDVRPWTIDSWREWRRMAWDRTGPVITNRPGDYLRWARVFCSR